MLQVLGVLALIMILRPSPANAESLIGFIRDSSGAVTTFAVAGSTYTNVTALNNAGQAAGFYDSGNYVYDGFIRNCSGAITTFSVSGSTYTDVTARTTPDRQPGVTTPAAA